MGLLFALLRRWLRRQGPRRPDLHVIMYTRAGCHLCADAWTIMTAHQARHRFALERIDVDASPELVARYGQCVPVVVMNGEVRFRGRVNEVLLKRILDRKT